MTNPISAFILIKELITNWRKVEKLMKENIADGYIQNLTSKWRQKQIRYPTEVKYQSIIRKGICDEA